MNNVPPSAANRPSHGWQKFRPAEATRERPDGQDNREQQPGRKGPRRTLTIVFRAR